MPHTLADHELVLLGAGHTHLHLLRMWKMHPIPGTRLTCISHLPIASYSGMLPGVLAGDYAPEEMNIDLIRRCAAVGARLILAETTGLDRHRKQLLLKDRAPLDYDRLSIGIGSRPSRVRGLSHALSIKPMQTFPQRLSEKLEAAARAGGEPLSIVVVGGGAAGVEVALCVPGWIRRQLPAKPWNLTLIHGGERLLHAGPRRSSEIVRRLLDQRGARTLLRHSAEEIAEQGVLVATPEGGREWIPGDVVIWATGAIGPALFESFDLAKDERGFLLVDVHLRAVEDPSIFVAGDSATCPSRPHPKAGVYAVRQGPILWENLRRSLANLPLKEWRPQSDFLSLMNSGDGQAVLRYKWITLHSRWAHTLKDKIDRRFMAKHRQYEPMGMRDDQAM